MSKNKLSPTVGDWAFYNGHFLKIDDLDKQEEKGVVYHLAYLGIPKGHRLPNATTPGVLISYSPESTVHMGVMDRKDIWSFK